jgi:hypothetical protein
MPNTLSRAYFSNARRYLETTDEFILAMRPHAAAIPADEYVRRTKDRSLSSVAFSALILELVGEIDHSDLAPATKDLLRVVFQPLVRADTPPMPRVNRAVKVTQGVQDSQTSLIGTVVNRIMGRPTIDIEESEEAIPSDFFCDEPALSGPPVNPVPPPKTWAEEVESDQDSGISDLADIATSAMSLIPGAGTVAAVAKTAVKINSVLNKRKASSSPTKPRKFNPKTAVALKDLPVVSDMEIPTSGYILDENPDVTVTSTQIQTRISNWAVHHPSQCKACDYIVTKARPNVFGTYKLDGAFKRKCLFVHLNASDVDFSDLYRRSYSDAAHWLNHEGTLTAQIIGIA